MTAHDTVSPAEVLAKIISDPALANAWRDVSLEPDEVLFSKGDAAESFYVVHEGEVEVFSPDSDGRRIILERMGAGSSFGELALLDGGVRAASVRAVDRARLGELERDAFLRVVVTSPQFAEVVLGFLGARLRRSAHYVDDVTAWASLVAKGDYDAAHRSIGQSVASAADPNIGRFASTFEEMIAAVRGREERLAVEITRLRIQIDAARLNDEVAAITETDFFKDLESRAQRSRERHEAMNED